MGVTHGAEANESRGIWLADPADVERQYARCEIIEVAIDE